MTHCGGPARLHENRTPKRGNWLRVRTVRAGGHGTLYGAYVTVRAGERRWRRRAQPGYGYLTSHDPGLHFGVGPAARVEVRVDWADGTHQAVGEVAVNRTIVVERTAES